MPLFSVLQMGASSSKNYSFKKYFYKNWDKFDPQSLKKTCLIFFCDTEWPQYPLEEGERWPVEAHLNYNIVLQLDWFCRKQGKLVEMPYVLLFFSPWDMSDLCRFGCETVAYLLPSLPLYLGLPIEQTENRGTLPGGVASDSVEIQTVPTVV